MKKDPCRRRSFYFMIICLIILIVFSQLLITAFLNYGTEYSGECRVYNQEIIAELWAQIRLCLLDSSTWCSTARVCDSSSMTEVFICLNKSYQLDYVISCYWYEKRGEELYPESKSHYNFYSLMVGVSGIFTLLTMFDSLYFYMKERRKRSLQGSAPNYGTLEEATSHFSLMGESPSQF